MVPQDFGMRVDLALHLFAAVHLVLVGVEQVVQLVLDGPHL